MKATATRRNQWLSVRLSAEEELKLRQLMQRTTARSLSEYARDVLLKAPVTVRYRNATADAFLEEMIGLKDVLTAMHNRLGEVVSHWQESHQTAERNAWFFLLEATRKELQQKTTDILEKLSQIYTLWSQE